MGKMKKYITIVLAAAMTAVLLPLPAMAAELPEPEEMVIADDYTEVFVEPEEVVFTEASVEDAEPEEPVVAEESAEDAALEEPVPAEGSVEDAEPEEVALSETDGLYRYTVVDGTAHITSYSGIATDLIVPETLGDYPVTCIAKHAFWYKTFNSITLPSTLRIIEAEAFDQCNVTQITISEGLESIGNKAFYNMKSLEKIVIPSTVTSIGDYAFYGCTKLKSLSLGNGVKSIGEYAFQNTRINSLTLPASMECLGKCAFWECKQLTTVKIKPGATGTIGAGAFHGCVKLTSVSIPVGITELGDGAFYGCSLLENVEIPTGVTKIGAGAFSKTSIKNPFIPACVENIGGPLFEECAALETISIDAENPNYDSRNNCNAIIESQTNTLIEGFKNTQIPDDIEIIEKEAFTRHSCPAEIHFPASLTKIGRYAFKDCADLKKITFSENSSVKIGYLAFNNCANLSGTLRLYPGIVLDAEYIFGNCSSLTKVVLPDAYTSIPAATFAGCSGLKSVNLPESLTDLGAGAFENCSSLTSISFPANLTSLSNRAFAGCNSLTSVEIPENIVMIGFETFLHCEKLASVTLPSDIRIIGVHAFACENLKNVYYDGGKKLWNTIESFDNSADEYIFKGFGGVYPFGFPEDATFHYKSIPVQQTLELGAISSIDLMPQNLPAGIAPEDIGWESDNTEAAVVDSNGRVSGIARGSAVVTAYLKEDPSIKGSCKITVLFADATHENVTSGIFKAIYWVADKKITGEKVYFGTNNTITRGQFVRFLYRYAGSPKVTNTQNPFKDVDSSYTHYKAIMWAVGKGLIGGYTINGKQYFKPNESVDRYSVATVLWKLAGSPKVKNAEKPFVDVAKSTPIAWGAEMGIIKGYSDGTFKPKAKNKRGDFALILYRYNKYVGKK